MSHTDTMLLDGDRYHELKRYLSVDVLQLTEELEHLAEHTQDAAEGAAEAQRLRDDAKDNLEVVKAIASSGLRGFDPSTGKARSEKQIESELILDETVVLAMAHYRQCEYSAEMWKSLAYGMRTKGSSIKVISDLIASGYTSPQSIYADRRTRGRESNKK